MKMCCLIISGGWGSLVLLNQCSSDICISMENRIIYVYLDLYYLVCLMCLTSISIGIRVVLTKVLY